MKKVSLLLTLLLTTFTSLFSQSFEIECFAGLSRGNIRAKNLNSNRIFAINGGVVASYRISQLTRLKFGFILGPRGGDISANSTNRALRGSFRYSSPAPKTRVELRFIDVPILLSISNGNSSIAGGPQFAFLSDAHSTINKDQFRDVEVGLRLQYQYLFNSGVLTGLDFTQGFNNVLKTEGQNWKTHSLQAYIGYKIRSKIHWEPKKNKDPNFIEHRVIEL